MEKIDHDFLERLRKGKKEKYLFDKDVYKFDKKDIKYFKKAEKILIELTYEKIGKRYSYYGDEGQDIIYMKFDDGWYYYDSLSNRGSASRTLCVELFMERKLEKFIDKLLFVLHDMTKKKVVGIVQGYDIKKIKNLEEKIFGCKMFHPWEMYKPIIT